MQLIVKYFENQQLVATANLVTTLELGRQRQGELTQYSHGSSQDRKRMIIAGCDETNVSRRHLVLNLNDDGSVSVENTNQHLPIRLRNLHGISKPSNLATANGGNEADERTQKLIVPGGKTRFAPPALIIVNDKAICIEHAKEGNAILSGLENTTLPPARSPKAIEPFRTLFADNETNDRVAVLDWLHKAMGVFQQAASSPEFFSDAARAVVGIVDLDAAGILFLSEGDWQTKAVAFNDSADEVTWQPSHTILNRVAAENRVFRQLPESSDGQASLQDVVAVVAAPILSADGTVIGAIYGDRRQCVNSVQDDVEISLLEAKLVEILSSAVAAGLARLTQEQAAVTARTQFEQFFSPELAKELEIDAGLLEGRDTEVTMLFMDIRGFSSITEKLGPEATLEWINDLLGRFSECVFAESGVLIEYIGDELFAMWGAPTPCSDQANCACRAGLRMLAAVPELDERWRLITGEALKIGIGINTGVSRVGNVGSKHRFKYGPLGNAVNLASRLQGATKYLGRPLLISGATAKQLDDSFATRRLCTIRVNNIRQPVEIYDLAAQATPQWREFQTAYDLALEYFEKGNFPASIKILAGLIAEHVDDEPSLLLMSRAVELISQHRAGDFDLVWELPGK